MKRFAFWFLAGLTILSAAALTRNEAYEPPAKPPRPETEADHIAALERMIPKPELSVTPMQVVPQKVEKGEIWPWPWTETERAEGRIEADVEGLRLYQYLQNRELGYQAWIKIERTGDKWPKAVALKMIAPGWRMTSTAKISMSPKSRHWRQNWTDGKGNYSHHVLIVECPPDKVEWFRVGVCFIRYKVKK